MEMFASIDVFIKSSLFIVTSSFKVLFVMLSVSSTFLFFVDESASLPSSHEEEDLLVGVTSSRPL